MYIKAQGPRNLLQATEVAGDRPRMETLLLPKYLPEWFSIYGTHYNHLEEWLSGQRMLDTHQEYLMADVES